MPLHQGQAITLLSELIQSIALGERGNEIALGDDQVSFTYREYLAAADAVAAGLRQLNVMPGDRVGVHLRKTAFSFIAVHGVLRAGAVMVPIDPFAPVDHFSRVVDDAAIAVVITDVSTDRLAQIVDATSVAGAIVRGDASHASLQTVHWDDLANYLPVTVEVRSPDDDAYIIYTSGSTGRPKGIVHTHRSALAYARLAAAEYDLGGADRLANIASLHFDQSTFELYAAPLVGAAVTVVPDVLLRFPANLSELIERDRVTVWYSVPYVIRQLVTRGALEQRDLSALRWVLYGGEPFPPHELAAFMQAVPQARVSNVYGPAELNQCMVYNLSEPPVSADAIPIGRAWADTELRVVDDEGRAVTSGRGELFVSSTTMMDRYWNRPDLTEAAISQRSFDDAAPTRWYRTGDLVEFTATGDLVFLGRADNQVKVRGQRIELEAIDQTVRSIDAVAEIAMVVEETDAGNHLVALVQVEPGHEITPRAVQRTISRHHPQVAVPTDVFVVDELARTGTGKIDRNAAASVLRDIRSADSQS